MRRIGVGASRLTSSRVTLWTFVVALVLMNNGAIAAHAQPKCANCAPAVPDTSAMRLSRILVPRNAYNELVARALDRSGDEHKAQQKELKTEAVSYEEVLALAAGVYKARFSEKELDEILAFCKTATGIKWVKELTGCWAEIERKVHALVTERAPDGPEDKMIRASGEAASARTRLDKLRVNQASLSQKPVPPEGMSGALERHYPPRARAAGVSGSATLVVRILGDGRVDHMQVLRETSDGAWPAPDFGFGDACRSALEEQLWLPAVDKSGRVVATDIGYKCEFEVADASPTLSISVDVDGKLYLDGQLIEEAALQDKIRFAHKVAPYVKALISADGRVRHAQVVKIISLLRGENLSNITIITGSEPTSRCRLNCER